MNLILSILLSVVHPQMSSCAEVNAQAFVQAIERELVGEQPSDVTLRCEDGGTLIARVDDGRSFSIDLRSKDQKARARLVGLAVREWLVTLPLEAAPQTPVVTRAASSEVHATVAAASAPVVARPYYWGVGGGASVGKGFAMKVSTGSAFTEGISGGARGVLELDVAALVALNDRLDLGIGLRTQLFSNYAISPTINFKGTVFRRANHALSLGVNGALVIGLPNGSVAGTLEPTFLASSFTMTKPWEISYGVAIPFAFYSSSDITMAVAARAGFAYRFTDSGTAFFIQPELGTPIISLRSSQVRQFLPIPLVRLSIGFHFGV